jgi:hypothetical protein
LQVGYSYSNQFELPVLFYVLTILACRLRGAGLDIRDLPLSAGLRARDQQARADG